MGARAGRGRARGRDPDRAARHLLPQQRLRGARPRACSCATPTATRSAGRSGRAAARTTRPDRRGDPLGARGAARAAADGRRGRGRRAAARPPLRAGRRERRLPRGVRRHPDPAARRGRRARPDDHAPCTPPTSPTTTSSCSAPPAPTPASARPPSATSATASARAARLHDAGCPLTLGSDSHAVIDLFEEMRAVEMDERLATQRARPLDAPPSCSPPRRTGHASLGFADAGEIAVGHRADLVTLDTASPRTAGTGADEHTAVFAATAADVVQVVVDGRVVVHAGRRRGDRPRARRARSEALA